eukprot:234891-Rhodomonas_salina.1
MLRTLSLNSCERRLRATIALSERLTQSSLRLSGCQEDVRCADVVPIRVGSPTGYCTVFVSPPRGVHGYPGTGVPESKAAVYSVPGYPRTVPPRTVPRDTREQYPGYNVVGGFENKSADRAQGHNCINTRYKWLELVICRSIFQVVVKE